MSLSEGDISNNKIISTLIKKRLFIYSGLDRSFDCSSFIFIRSLSLIVISSGNGDFDLFLQCWCVCSRRINHQSSIGNVLDCVIYHIESRKNRWIWNVSQKLFHYMQPSSYTVFSPLSSILWLVAPLLESSHRKIILDFPWDKELLLLPLGKSPQGMAHRGDCVWWEIES